jgi:hypothetical protein
MASRSLTLLLVLGALSSAGAAYQTDNFVVEAESSSVAGQVARAAERQRKQVAVCWLGRELPDWPEPCAIEVHVAPGPVRGVSSFTFADGALTGLSMRLDGPLDRLLQGCLPHELTHVIFAHHFGRPVPRWADEGGAVLSEDDRARRAHERLLPEILRTPGRAFALRQLLRLSDYPEDVGALYGQGYSVTHFLVESASRKTFLAFVALGMRGDWDRAVRTHYRYKNVEDLERAWLRWHQDKSRPDPLKLPSETRVAFP